MVPCFCGAPAVVPIAHGRWIGGRNSGDKCRYSVCTQRVMWREPVMTLPLTISANGDNDNMNTNINDHGNAAAPPGGDHGSGNGDGDGNSGPAKKRTKARPRLTVQPEVMERLRKVAVEREMTASELAEELLSQFLEQVPDEIEEVDSDRKGEEEEEKGKVDAALSSPS